MTRVPISPEMLTWACERAGYDVEHFAKKIPQLNSWVKSERHPTFRQLEKLADLTHTPFGFLFLPEPPDEPIPVTDYRTVTGASRDDWISPNLRETIYAMERRQDWLRRTLIEEGMPPLPFVSSAHLRDEPEEVGREMRQVLGLNDGWAAEIRTWQSAVGELRRLIEGIDVMAVINGIVGNNTHRKLNVEEFRGFALTDPYAPLIFVNGADAKSAQMFTLAHELAHIWLGKEGLSGFEMLSPGGTDVEKWCNRAAAELLVPAEELRRHWREANHEKDQFQILARKFKVSPIVIARRALNLEFIPRSTFSNFYEDYVGQERKDSTKSGGGNFYTIQDYRVGKPFALKVLRAAKEGRIQFKEAHDLTGLRGDSLEKYAK